MINYHRHSATATAPTIITGRCLRRSSPAAYKRMSPAIRPST